MKKQIFIGFIVGILVAVAGFYLYVELALKGTFEDAIAIILEKKLLGKIISIGAIPNLLVFFLFIKKRQDYKARGVLIATFLIAFFVLISQFL